MIYRKHYGNNLASRRSPIFLLVLCMSGLITEGIFLLFSVISNHHMGKMLFVKCR